MDAKVEGIGSTNTEFEWKVDGIVRTLVEAEKAKKELKSDKKLRQAVKKNLADEKAAMAATKLT